MVRRQRCTRSACAHDDSSSMSRNQRSLLCITTIINTSPPHLLIYNAFENCMSDTYSLQPSVVIKQENEEYRVLRRPRTYLLRVANCSLQTFMSIHFTLNMKYTSYIYAWILLSATAVAAGMVVRNAEDLLVQRRFQCRSLFDRLGIVLQLYGIKINNLIARSPNYLS